MLTRRTKQRWCNTCVASVLAFHVYKTITKNFENTAFQTNSLRNLPAKASFDKCVCCQPYDGVLSNCRPLVGERLTACFNAACWRSQDAHHPALQPAWTSTDHFKCQNTFFRLTLQDELLSWLLWSYFMFLQLFLATRKPSQTITDQFPMSLVMKQIYYRTLSDLYYLTACKHFDSTDFI